MLFSVKLTKQLQSGLLTIIEMLRKVLWQQYIRIQYLNTYWPKQGRA